MEKVSINADLHPSISKEVRLVSSDCVVCCFLLCRNFSFTTAAELTVADARPTAPQRRKDSNPGAGPQNTDLGGVGHGDSHVSDQF